MRGNKKQELVSNPFSTGGGGTVFEHKVQASLLTCLLVRSHVPGFDAATISELHFQAEHLGYETDDAVLLATDSSGHIRKQLWSVKHDVRFTRKDEVFQDVLRDAWKDFLNPDRFDQNRDTIVIATGPLPVTYKHLLTLLEIIRATSSFSDFENKAAREGFLSQEAHDYFHLIRASIEGITNTKPSSSEVWKFLKIFHILGFDFDQVASKDEARFKSLLALAIRAGTGGSGEELWNRVFKWVAEGNPRAGSFTHGNLPENWRRDANAISVHFESGVVERLSEHSKLTLRRVRSKIGVDHQLPRTDLIGRLATSFLEQPMTLVSGEAGVGKSAAAWMALQQVTHGAPVFVFQAKEFAHDHLDHALADMRIHESLSQISSLFGFHRRKFILLESVERLLEASERDAFADLLTVLTKDPTWRVVLTCRHHAVNLVKDSFLIPAGIHSYHISVPRLNPDELDLVLSRKQDLRAIVKDDRTRSFLRNPWFLDKACSVNWSKTSDCPLDQTQLREVLWRQIVAREDATHGGIHRKRDRVFREIALGRARSLKSFVEAPEGEEAAVQALLADELLVEDSATGFVAPAHDVLEDWALVRWVAQVFDSVGHNPLSFFNELGRHLPVRRAYRQWLHESLDGSNHLPAGKFTDAVLSLANVPNYWRDETVISLLFSYHAPQFIQNHEARLIANGKEQLKVVIHLMRLACKKPNPFWNLPEHIMAKQFGDTHLTPDGAAWSAIIQLIHRNLSQFDSHDLPYLLALLEDWKSGINWQDPQPAGTREAGLVALHFWKLLDDDYDRKDDLRRLLDVMLTIPQAFPKEFEAMVREGFAEAKDDSNRSYRKEWLDEKFLSFEGSAMVCRSHPSLVAEIARRKWYLDRPRSPRSGYGGGEMESYFGLPASSFEYFPSSALQGPFRILLSNHQEIGINLILDLLNTTTQRFVESGLGSEFESPPLEIEIMLDDQTSCKQWVTERLWLMHRGTMPAPDIVESALMALEKHLLELAEAQHDLTSLSRDLIVRSNSIAITSVVASVAMAHPKAVGDTALIFLGHYLFFELDLLRYIKDRSFFDIGEGGYDQIQKIHHRERIESSKLAHRKQNLESLALNLQAGPLKNRVWEILDSWNEELQAIEEQTEEVILLRLKFHRIDIRNFTSKQTLDDGRVVFTSSKPAADVAQVVSETAPLIEAKNEAAELIVWGSSVFDGRDSGQTDRSDWRRMLERARHAVEKGEQSEETEMSAYEGGPGYVAAVCVRDHWKELDVAEQEWCRDFLLTEFVRGKDTRNPILRARSFPLSCQVPAAKVLPILLDDSDETTASRVREALAVGLTHSIGELRDHTALGISDHLWDRDPELANYCISALLDFAGKEADLQERWLSQRPRTRGSWDDAIEKETSRIRKSIAEKRTIETTRSIPFDPVKRINPRTLISISYIIAQRQHLPIAQAFYLQVAKYFVTRWNKTWDREDEYRSTRDYQGEAALKHQFEHFLVRCDPAGAVKLWTPFNESIGVHGEKVADLFEGLVVAEDLAQRGEGFWRIWDETKQAIFAIPGWNEKLGYDQGGLAKLTSALLFDGVPWKEEAREWAPLRGHEVEVREFAMQVATTPRACKSLIRLLDGIGAFLLPQALLWLDEVFKKGDIRLLIGKRNVLFHLSRILSPFVFGRTSLIRSDQALREAALRILDAMIDQGSSAAYRMRDILISPIAVNRVQ